MDPVHEVLGRSAFVSLTATAIALGVGVPLGTWLALGRRRGRGVLATAVNTGMAVPTVVVGLLVALLLVMHAQLWTGRGSVGNVTEMKRKLEALQAANTQAQQRNERLASEVRDLKEGLEMVEEKARLELGMVKPNEILVQIAK